MDTWLEDEPKPLEAEAPPTTSNALPITTSVTNLLLHNLNTAEDWEVRDLVRELYKWYDIFNVKFFTSTEEPLREPILGFDDLNIRTLAHYYFTRNQLGLFNVIELNLKHVNATTLEWVHGPWSMLESLLHEMLHSWQDSYGKMPSLSTIKVGKGHNKQFVAKALELGLHVQLGQGYHTDIADGAFAELMAEYNIPRPVVLPAEAEADDKRHYWDRGQPKKWGHRRKQFIWQCSGCGEEIKVTNVDFPGVICVQCAQAYINITDIQATRVEEDSTSDDTATNTENYEELEDA
jgi:hypothetical protein